MPQPGKYWAVNLRGTLTESGAKKTPTLAVKIDVTHEPKGDEWVEMQTKYERTLFFYLSDAARESSMAKLERIGFNGNFAAPEFSVEGVEVECNHETYEGKNREKWELAGGSYTPTPAGEELARQMNRLWKSRQTGKAPAPKGKPASPPTAKSKSETVPPSDEEIPF